MLKRLVEAGIEYVFVSNSDNLGATLDLDLLAYFAETGKSFIMEVCVDTLLELSQKLIVQTAVCHFAACHKRLSVYTRCLPSCCMSPDHQQVQLWHLRMLQLCLEPVCR